MTFVSAAAFGASVTLAGVGVQVGRALGSLCHTPSPWPPPAITLRGPRPAAEDSGVEVPSPELVSFVCEPRFPSLRNSFSSSQREGPRGLE